MKWWLSVILAVVVASPLQAEEEVEPKAKGIDDFSAEEVARIIQPDPDRRMPWVDGEVLTYALGWSFFDVGTTEMTIEATEWEGEAAWKFTLKTQTNRFADNFYRVRNEVRTYANRSMTGTLYFENDQREGNRDRHYEVRFDPVESTAEYINLADPDDKHEPVWVFPGSFDPFGITLFVRSLPIVEGGSYVIPTTNGREPFLTSIEVTGVDERRFRIGRQEAWVLEPEIEDLGGVFRRSRDGSIKIWFSRDRYRYPLRMESSVAVGRFWAELIQVERPNTGVIGEEEQPRLERSGPRRR